jgi:hypothetical protein
MGDHLVKRTLIAAAGCLLAVLGTVGADAATSTAVATRTPIPISNYVPPIKHVFVINIENKNYATTWGRNSAAPYLAKTLRRKGVLLANYYGTAHNSQPNYIAQISGQAPNPQMQGDCQLYSSFRGAGTVAPQQAVGHGCVFPRSVTSLPIQLSNAGYSWRGYMQDMHTACRHPTLDTQDGTQQAKRGDEYATRHDPFMYFRAITGRPDYCRSHVVPLGALRHDLAARASTRNLSYITPDLCSDGHDAPCVDGRPGGLKSVNAFLKTWVPRILNSAAFKANGMLVITADESDGPQSDASACCNERAGPNSPMPGITGMGGGQVGALVISRWVKPNSWSSTPYNHYSLLASVEDIFRRPRIGFARQAGLHRFALDVYNNYRTP